MPIWLAKWLYWRSLGFDMSEWPHAQGKDWDRRRLLRRRIGKEEFEKWEMLEDKDEPTSFLEFFLKVAIPIFVIFTIGVTIVDGPKGLGILFFIAAIATPIVIIFNWLDKR